MKKIGFIGAYDKTDLLLNIAKILTTMNNRTLIIDSTINQKAKYVVPAIDPTISYITSFEFVFYIAFYLLPCYNEVAFLFLVWCWLFVLVGCSQLFCFVQELEFFN